jgi:FtsH-binding integral membrane protein
MKHLHLKHWQDPVTALLGAWFAASPWILGFKDNNSAVAASLALGLAVVALAVGSMLATKPWEYWVAGALGIGIAISPWLLDFAGHQAAVRNAGIVGLTLFVLAVWALATETDLGSWRNDRMAR